MSASTEMAADMTCAGNDREETERQLLLLVEASGTLLASPQESDVVETVMTLAQRFVAADAYALWRQTGETTWNAIRTIGLSSTYSRSIDTTSVRSQIPRLSADPQVITDVENAPFVASRLDWYRREGIRSLVTIPLLLHGTLSGTLVFYYRQPRNFTEREIRIAGILANLAAAALGTSDLYERQKSLRNSAERSARRAAFLAEVGADLASSLDYAVTLTTIAEMTVPFFADWCGVSIIDDHGGIRRLTLRHADPAQSDSAQEVQKLLPPKSLLPVRLAKRLRCAQLVEQISEEILSAHVARPEQIELIRRLGLRSLICAPLVARGRTIGVLTFATAQSGRSYTHEDLEFARELAHRQALAVDNARLFADVAHERERSQQANRNLQAANEALQRANTDLEQFAYSASHDLQEPLRTVAVYSQLLERHLKGLLDEEAESFISYTVAAAKRMEVLVQDLLSYVKAATGVEPEAPPVNATRVLKETLVNLQAAVEQSGATVSSSDLPVVRVPAVHMRQLFQNLIGNAIKYRGAAAPRIEVSARRLGLQWEFAVADNGIGIDPKYATQVFGIFKRLHSSASYTGTGIGLAICQKIVERHGGRIWVESELGRGSIFRFTIPGQEHVS
ncbi:MAG TPA: ATP-binding protein [Bryobacteraceae bacterium]|nr:ATP-binding protein [Bryobacteraceae bacterium]